MQFHTSLHSKFQIRDWLKLTSACELTNLRSADVNLSQSWIWNLEWSKVQKCTIIADIIVHFCTSLHSKFQIRDWLKLTSVERRLVRLLADVTFSQSWIWNLEWSEGRKCTIISAYISSVSKINRPCVIGAILQHFICEQNVATICLNILLPKPN